MTELHVSVPRSPTREAVSLMPTALPWGRTTSATPREVFGEGDDLVTRHLSRVGELERRVAELELVNRELAAFAADVAHDLRSPLQAVAGFAELLVRREGTRLDETSQRFVAHIMSAARGMGELVEGALEHRRSSSVLLNLTRVDCTDLVTSVLRRLSSELSESGASIEVAELPMVTSDRVQLGRVFQNLVSNALKATPPGRVPVVALAARRVVGGWEFSVTDNGIGVAPGDRARIFDLFQRGAAGGGSGTGQGMGLAICRTIVERHGGCIGVEKAPGGGSRFSFTLPDRPPSGSSGEAQHHNRATSVPEPTMAQKTR